MLNSNLLAFATQLEKEYNVLFQQPDYAYAAQKTTPKALAEKMTISLAAGTANKDGEGIKRTCKHLKIGYSYKAIKEFLKPLD